MKEAKREVVIRFAGDSGDGIQLAGTKFTEASAFAGNDFSTFPDYPAEIRAPAGTIAGVSAFQIRIADHDIHTPGDQPEVLVVMNPAALKKNLLDLAKGGIIIANTYEFTPRNLKKAGFDSNPLEDGSLEGYRVIAVDITSMTREALKDLPLDTRSKDRCKNFFALGICYWMFTRPLEPTINWIRKKFANRPEIAEANVKALKSGYNFADISEIFDARYEIRGATDLEPGEYRVVNGNHSLAMGLIAACEKAGVSLCYCSYPITPASDILHFLASMKNYGVITFQAEDEIAAVCAAIGASYAGSMGVCGTSGPGLALKMEAIGLAVMAELPLIVIDVQRAGPSTGMPTKMEQSDLLQALFGRNGEAPVVVIAPSSPSNAFDIAYKAVEIALRYMVPVIILSDGYLANNAEPWLIPREDTLPDIKVETFEGNGKFYPYIRDEKTLARPRVIPGTPGLEHRIGGLEKEDITGNISYDPLNHEKMVRLRAEKVERVQDIIPPIEVDGEDEGDLLVLGWGSSEGAIIGGVNMVRREGYTVSRAHLNYLNPFPPNLKELLSRFKRVLIPENNRGQLSLLIKGNFNANVVTYSKVQGKPFFRMEIYRKLKELLNEECAG